MARTRQWYYDGALIGGATGKTHVLTSGQTDSDLIECRTEVVYGADAVAALAEYGPGGGGIITGESWGIELLGPAASGSSTNTLSSAGDYVVIFFDDDDSATPTITVSGATVTHKVAPTAGTARVHMYLVTGAAGGETIGFTAPDGTREKGVFAAKITNYTTTGEDSFFENNTNTPGALTVSAGGLVICGSTTVVNGSVEPTISGTSSLTTYSNNPQAAADFWFNCAVGTVASGTSYSFTLTDVAAGVRDGVSGYFLAEA